MTAREAGGEAGRPQSPDGGEQEATGQRERTAAEKITLAVSIFLILGLVALVTYVSITGGGEPPIVEARPLPNGTRHEGESYFLPVAVTNRGGQTAAEVMVQPSSREAMDQWRLRSSPSISWPAARRGKGPSCSPRIRQRVSSGSASPGFKRHNERGAGWPGPRAARARMSELAW